MPAIPNFSSVMAEGQSKSQTVLTPLQVAQLWMAAYNPATMPPAKRKQLAITMVAIAGAESSYNKDADNGIAAGLWQVNYRAHTQWSASQLKDPETNAGAAAQVYKSQGLGAWTTYTNGAYKRFIPQATTAVNSIFNNPGNLGQDASTAASDVANTVTGGISDLASPLTDIAKAVSFIFSLQFLYIVGGGVLLIVGLIMLIRSTSAGKTITDTAAGAAML